jgi:hypothetical protein
MPATAVYVVAAVAAVAAGIAFKEVCYFSPAEVRSPMIILTYDAQFVYDPHLAPKVERWWDEIKAHSRETVRRHRNRSSASAVDVRQHDPYDSDNAGGGAFAPRSPRSVASGVSGREHLQQSLVELQTIADRERGEWAGDERAGLRRRHGIAEEVRPRIWHFVFRFRDS